MKGSEQRTSACIICGEEAKYVVRGTPQNTYCKDCATDLFGDPEYLDKI